MSLPYLNTYRDRHGKQRCYFRRGSSRKALPGSPGSPAFIAAYQKALAATSAPASRKSPAKGSVEALVREFYGSREFGQLRDSTKREYRYRLEWLRTAHGDKPVAMISRRHVLRIRDERGETPGEGNTVLRIVKRLLSFAVEREYRNDNPATRIKLYKGGEFRAWTDSELAAFESRWPSGSPQRLAYALLLYTGQRRADVAKMTEHDFNGQNITVVQNKTGQRLSILVHPKLSKELAVRTARNVMLLTKAGKPFTSESLGQFLAQAIDDAKLPDDCVVHGLRKTAARTLAEVGCTEEEIMSVTGHVSPSMIRLYVRGASREKMATSAVLKWQKGSQSPEKA